MYIYKEWNIHITRRKGAGVGEEWLVGKEWAQEAFANNPSEIRLKLSFWRLFLFLPEILIINVYSSSRWVFTTTRTFGLRL